MLVFQCCDQREFQETHSSRFALAKLNRSVSLPKRSSWVGKARREISPARASEFLGSRLSAW